MPLFTASTAANDPAGNGLEQALRERFTGILMVPFAAQGLPEAWERAFRTLEIFTSPEEVAQIALPWHRAGFEAEEAATYAATRGRWTIGDAIPWHAAGWEAGQAVLMRKVADMWQADDAKAPNAETWRDLGLSPRWTLACAGAGCSPADAVRLDTGTQASMDAMLQAALANGCDVDGLFLE